jgi:hypothetical protein
MLQTVPASRHLRKQTHPSVLDESGKRAFQNYLNKGGNFIGVHSASDCLRATEFFGKEIGAWFDYHPELSDAVCSPSSSQPRTLAPILPPTQIVNVVDNSHPSTSMLPAQWNVRDEMCGKCHYSFFLFYYEVNTGTTSSQIRALSAPRWSSLQMNPVTRVRWFCQTHACQSANSRMLR